MLNKIKHVFERVATAPVRHLRNLSEVADIVGDTLVQMFDIRTCDRVQFEHKSE